MKKLKKRAIFIILILLVFIYSLPDFYFSLQSQIAEIQGNNYFVYLPNDTVKSFNFLDKNTTPDSVVFAGFFMGELLPAYTHNRVYVGRPDATYNYDAKVALLTKFFSHQMSFAEVKNFLRKGKISYIFLGPDTPKPSETPVPGLNFVNLIYQSGDNYIYKVAE